MSQPKRQMRLGAFLTATGQHPAAWRHPRVMADGGDNIAHYLEAVRIAEDAGFDMMFLADNAGLWDRDLDAGGYSSRVSHFEPITLLSAMAAVTSRIGLVGTMTTSFNEPYNVARKYASLDLLSSGRAGWNLVTSANHAEALNFNLDEHLPHARRYEIAEEFAEVVVGLWDSFEDDAFARDKESGLFYHAEKMHFLNYVGEHYKVRGPLNVSRSPQGRPIIVQAGSSEPGIDLAARCADVVFTAQANIDSARTFYATQKAAMARYGRHPDHLLIMPGLAPVVGETAQEAQAKFDELQALIHPVIGLGLLSSMAGGVDLSRYPVDGPLPELPDDDISAKGRRNLLVDMARRENLTIRQLYMRVAGARGHNTVIGTATDIADVMEDWFATGAADGFNIMPLALPDSLSDFTRLVIPELRRRGLFRERYEAPTLRGNLGLPWPAYDSMPPRSNRRAAGDAERQHKTDA